MTKLYAVTTTAPELFEHKDVEINWFVSERQLPVERPYAELISNYDPADDNVCYPKLAIDELFDEAEVAAFVAWLKVNRGADDEDTKVSEAKLPIAITGIGYRAIPVGGGTGFLRELADGTQLGFAVAGYYDLRHCEQIEAAPAPPTVLGLEQLDPTTAAAVTALVAKAQEGRRGLSELGFTENEYGAFRAENCTVLIYPCCGEYEVDITLPNGELVGFDGQRAQPSSLPHPSQFAVKTRPWAAPRGGKTLTWPPT